MKKPVNMRLWYPTEKRMVYTGMITFDLRDCSWMWEGRHGSFHSHFGELMYGTGIIIIHKGKERELFEGDIIRVGGKEGNTVEIVRNERGGGFNTKPEITYASWGWEETICDHSDRIEYLGNVFETPELQTFPVS